MAADQEAGPSAGPASPLPALYFQPLKDRDVALEVVVAQEDATGPETPDAERRAVAAAAAEAALAAPTAQIVSFEASSQLLKSASSKFWCARGVISLLCCRMLWRCRH